MWMNADGSAYICNYSANGTWINCARMQAGGQAAPLDDGDKISFPSPPGGTVPTLTFKRKHPPRRKKSSCILLTCTRFYHVRMQHAFFLSNDYLGVFNPTVPSRAPSSGGSFLYPSWGGAAYELYLLGPRGL